MNNCLFDDTTLYLNVSPKELFVPCASGYKSSIFINKKDVLRLMERDIVPHHDGNSVFSLDFRLNNNTQILMNGIRVTSLADERLRYIPIDLVRIKQLILARYSPKTKSSEQCYATRFSLQLKTQRVIINDKS